MWSIKRENPRLGISKSHGEQGRLMPADKPKDKLARLLSDALAAAPSDSGSSDGSLSNDVDLLRQHLEQLLATCDESERKAIADQIAVLLSFDPDDAAD